MLRNIVPVTDALSSALPAAVDYEQVQYTPSLRLDVSGLPDTFVRDQSFASGCEAGFDDCCGAICSERDGGSFLVKELVQGLCETLLQEPALRSADLRYPFAWHVGYEIGWLSALALSWPTEARAGLSVLVTLVVTLERFGHVRRVPCVRPVLVGGDRWPLDV